VATLSVGNVARIELLEDGSLVPHPPNNPPVDYPLGNLLPLRALRSGRLPVDRPPANAQRRLPERNCPASSARWGYRDSAQSSIPGTSPLYPPQSRSLLADGTPDGERHDARRLET
jgi:hypothetical protein